MLIHLIFLLFILVPLSSCDQNDIDSSIFIDHYSNGKKNMKTNNFRKARLSFSKVKSDHDNYADALNEMGFCYIELDDIDSALFYFHKTTNVRNDYYISYSNLGYIYEVILENSDSAYYYYNKAILTLESNKYNDHIPYYNRGSFLLDNNNFKLAISDFNIATKHKEDHHQSHNKKGLCYTELGMYDSAQVQISKAIDLSPSNSIYFYNQGRNYFFQNNFESSLNAYNRSISLYDEYSNCYINRGFLYAQMGNTDAAFLDYNRVIEIDPNNGIAYWNRGDLNYLLGNIELTSPDWEKATELDVEGAKNAYLELCQ